MRYGSVMIFSHNFPLMLGFFLPSFLSFSTRCFFLFDGGTLNDEICIGAISHTYDIVWVVEWCFGGKYYR